MISYKTLGDIPSIKQQDIPKYQAQQSFNIFGKYCLTDKQFFQHIKKSFDFPDYFGMNWSAFSDCLRDLEYQNTTVFIFDYPQIFSQENNQNNLVSVFVEVINDLVDDFGKAEFLIKYDKLQPPISMCFYLVDSSEK